jgi:hypothetical protein
MDTLAEKLQTWFDERVPDGWFSGPLEIWTDRDEILVAGTLPEPVEPPAPGPARSAALAVWVQRFREDTRARRIQIAAEAEQRFGRTIAWSVRCGGVHFPFTSLSIPVMTRLRLAERRVLDTLVDAGVARSRSDALAWCVRLVLRNEEAWIDQLREALVHVEQVRAEGPEAE